jgi:muconate cycloisomerase
MPVVAGNPFTKAAIEMALWDIAGKAVGKPVYEVLGGKVREFVPTKWSISGREPAVAREIAQWALDQGFKKMKVKVGIDFDSDIARVNGVRETVGGSLKLGVDANGGWGNADNANRAIDSLRQFDLQFIEQPVPAGDIFGMVEVRKHAQLPVIADESCYTLQDAHNLAYANAADVFSIYIGKAGGIGPAKRICDFAASVGTPCTIGSNLELGLGSAAMAHLGLSSKAVTAETYACDIIGPFYYEDDILRDPLPLKGGEARVHDRPGLGAELDDAKVEKYRVR